MKKILLLMIVSIIFVTVGCAKNDDNRNNNSIKVNNNEVENNIENPNQDIVANEAIEGLEEVEIALNGASENAKAALNVVINNIESENERDVEGYLYTLSKKNKEGKKERVEEHFDQIDYLTTIIKLAVMSESDEEIVIGIRQYSGEEIIDPNSDNIGYVTLKHTLILEDDVYKIDDSEIIEEISKENLE